MWMQGEWRCVSEYFSNQSSKFRMQLLLFCNILTFINSSKLIFPSWSRSPAAIKFSVISLTLYPGRGKHAALNKSFNSLQLMYPLPSVSVRQTTRGRFRAIRLRAGREVRGGWVGGEWAAEAITQGSRLDPMPESHQRAVAIGYGP